jgi:hypothetical protein
MAEVHNPCGLSCRAKRWRDADFDAVEINLERDWPFVASVHDRNAAIRPTAARQRS